MLTFEDVEHHVSCLPRDVIERLALGPVDDGDAPLGAKAPCRVCDVLGPLRGTPSRAALHANELLVWHDINVGTLGEFADDADVELVDALGLEENPAADKFDRVVFGALAYARCCAIYALARALATSIRSAT